MDAYFLFHQFGLPSRLDEGEDPVPMLMLFVHFRKTLCSQILARHVCETSVAVLPVIKVPVLLYGIVVRNVTGQYLIRFRRTVLY